MKKVLLIGLLGLFGFAAQAESCKPLASEKIICRLDSQAQGEKISAQMYSQDCEFPEGNKRRCIKFRVCSGEQKIEEGMGVLFEGGNLDLYCRQKKDVDLVMSKRNVEAYVDCSKSKRSTQKIILKNNGLSTFCNLVTSKGDQ